MPRHDNAPRVLFRVAAGPRMGFGHLVRALSLARALGVRPIVFVRGPRGAADVARTLGARVAADGSATDVLRREGPDVLVIDDRVAGATGSWRRAARHLGVPIVSIHDLGLGIGDADLMVDGSVGAKVPAGFATPVNKRRAGARHALVGPEFAILNPRCVETPRSTGNSPRHPSVVVALGGGPRHAVALRLAGEISRRNADADVFVAGGFVGCNLETRSGRVRWVRPADLGRTLRAATVAVVAGGVTLYEACCLGVPAVATAVVTSQEPTVRGFAARMAVVDGGSLAVGAGHVEARVRGLAGRVGALLADEGARRHLARHAAALVDGQGARRVASAIRALAVAAGGRGKAVTR